MTEKAKQLFAELQQAIASDKLVLPTLPEVALKVRDAVENENSTAEDISEILGQDASLSARLIQVVNSPLYRGRNPIESLKMAVTRLGVKLVRDIVLSMAMKQIYQATSDVLDEQFRNTWSASVEIAAISRMLATTCPNLEPEQALLAGLVHNIGTLPILVMAEDDDELFNDETLLKSVIAELQGKVGSMILESWHFPQSHIDVVNECYNFARQHEGPADYVDVVQVALLQGGFVDEMEGASDWSAIPAFEKLGMDTEINAVELEENQLIIEETKGSFFD